MNSQYLEVLFSKLRLKKGFPYIRPASIVVDLGCGPQAMSLHTLSSHIRSGIGIDKEVVPRQEKNLKLIRLNFDKKPLPILDNSVDYVLMFAVIEHVSHPRLVLREAKRILKTEGTLILTTPTIKAKPFLEILAFKFHLIESNGIAEHKKYYSKKDMENVCHDLGLHIKKHTFFEMGFNSLFIITK
jgi:ubiquinone/menaquinone biosynthesis C-methylase UbiE